MFCYYSSPRLIRCNSASVRYRVSKQGSNTRLPSPRLVSGPSPARRRRERLVFVCCQVWEREPGACELLPAQWWEVGGGKGPRDDHTPAACVGLFQNRGQHLVILHESCTRTHTRVRAHIHACLPKSAVTGPGGFSVPKCSEESCALDFFYSLATLGEAGVRDSFTRSGRTHRKGQCLDPSWSRSTSLDRNRTTVNWNVRMVS